MHLQAAQVDGQAAEDEEVGRGGGRRGFRGRRESGGGRHVRVPFALRGFRGGSPVERGAAQQGADAGDEDGDVHRFDHVVVGAGLQPGHDVEGVAPGGHHQDGGQTLLADPSAQADAVEAREHHVQDQHIVRPGPERLQAVEPVPGDVDLVAVAFQGQLHRAADDRVVLDEQHGDRVGHTSGGQEFSDAFARCSPGEPPGSRVIDRNRTGGAAAAGRGRGRKAGGRGPGWYGVPGRPRGPVRAAGTPRPVGGRCRWRAVSTPHAA